MNGRIYDPTLGRFLQADPFIQAPKNSQNYNRYSYVLNNPMSYTDPSGYFFVSMFKGIRKFVKKYWKVIAAAAVSYFTFGATSGWAAGWALGSGFSASAAGFMGAMAGGAAAGFVSGAIMTGSLRGALKGAFIGAATGGIFEGVAQYGFGTSTVGVAAEAMQLEQAGVSRETIAKLYGSDGSSRSISKQEYSSVSAKGAGKFSEKEIQQLQDALSTTKTNASKKVIQNKLGRDNTNLTKHFGTAKEAKTVLSSTQEILDLANQANINSFVKVDGFCGANALACVVPAHGNNVFIEPGFFDPNVLAANYAAPGITQAHVLTHEFAHLAGMGHSLSYSVTNQMVLGNLVLSPSMANSAINNAESYAWYINGF